MTIEEVEDLFVGSDKIEEIQSLNNTTARIFYDGWVVDVIFSTCDKNIFAELFKLNYKEELHRRLLNLEEEMVRLSTSINDVMDKNYTL